MSYDEQRAPGPLCVADEQIVDRATLRGCGKKPRSGALRRAPRPPVAFGLAAVLDELARHLHDLAALPRRPPA